MNLNILIIDDKQIFCDGLSRILKQQDYLVDFVHNSEIAMNVIKENKYDLILLDINLPGKSGIDLFPEIQLATNSSIILITAYPDVATRLKISSIHPQDYWVKSSKYDELLIKIKKTLKIQEI